MLAVLAFVFAFAVKTAGIWISKSWDWIVLRKSPDEKDMLNQTVNDWKDHKVINKVANEAIRNR